mmetsp:Transcript_72888/g.159276  ORF Transcript_72888/g.159276 Transcript_72888/m.159276 type:complete len:146 (+) Transcript_72888:582-1019(+)
MLSGFAGELELLWRFIQNWETLLLLRVVGLRLQDVASPSRPGEVEVRAFPHWPDQFLRGPESVFGIAPGACFAGRGEDVEGYDDDDDDCIDVPAVVAAAANDAATVAAAFAAFAVRAAVGAAVREEEQEEEEEARTAAAEAAAAD